MKAIDKTARMYMIGPEQTDPAGSHHGGPVRARLDRNRNESESRCQHMKHKTNRILSLFLALVLTAGLLPLAAQAESPGTFMELEGVINQTTSGTLKLEKDYQCEDGFSAYGIVIEKTMTIDLNGHTIDGNGQARIFFVNSEVNLTLEGPGTITGGVAAAGGGIYADAYAALSLQNVEISGNVAAGGGGIYADANVTLSLQNVEISGNHAAGGGGGIYAGANAKLSLQNVEISGNTAGGQGGGIYADANAKLSLQNVEISGNTADTRGGGIFLSSGAQELEIGGETIVSGNTRKISGGSPAADNVYLYGPQLTVTSPLTGNAKIGLSPDFSSTSPEMLAEFGGMPLGAGFNTNHPEADIGAFFVSDDQSICIFNRDHDHYDMFCSRHTHQMECRPNPENGAELEYVCTAGSCPMPSPFAKLTLVAENRAYNGQEYDDAWLDDLAQFNQITGLNLVLSDDNGYYLHYHSGEDTGFSFSPLDPGSYWAVFVANGDPSKTIKKNFKIMPAPLTIKPKTQTFTYNEAIQGPGDTAYAGSDVEAAVEVSGLADGDRVTSVTIDGQGREIGTYELEITGLRIENSKGIDVTACYDITYEKGSLVIGKKPLTLGLTMDGWATGGSGTDPVYPVLTGNEGNGDVTYKYKPKGADDAAYSPDIPTAAGEYTVRATVKETEYHFGGEKTADFTVSHFSLKGINLKVNKSEKKHLDCNIDYVWDAQPPYGWGALSSSFLEDIDGNTLPWDDEPTPGAIRYMQTVVTLYAEDFINLSGMKKEDIHIVQCSDVTVSVHELKRFVEGVGEVGEDEEVEGVWRIGVLFKVVQNEAPPTGITLDSTAAKTEYFIGEVLDVSGLVLTASYSDNSTKKIDVTKEMISGFDSSKTGKQTLTVTYEGFEAKYGVEVKAQPVPVTLTGISLDSRNAKREYAEGEALDVSGLVLTAEYSDNSTKKIDVTKEMVSGFDSKTPGSQTLTVTYEGFEAKYEVEVKAQPVPVTLTGISLDSNSAKREYAEGEALDVSGLVLTAQYSDGSEKQVAVTEDMVSGFDSKTPGSQTLTVTYESFTDTYEVEVKAETNPPVPTIIYTAKDGSGNTIQSVTWQKGSGKNLDLTFKRSEDDHLTYGLFGSLEIDGQAVGSANYGAAEGSLKLSVKPEYLETLSVGDHTVKVNFQDGSATVKLTVLAASAQPTPSPTPKPSEKPTSPKTGDERILALWSSLMFLSVAAMIVLLLYARKRKTEK